LQLTLPPGPTVVVHVELPVHSMLHDAPHAPSHAVWAVQLIEQAPPSPPHVEALKAQLVPELQVQVAPLQVGADVAEPPHAPSTATMDENAAIDRKRMVRFLWPPCARPSSGFSPLRVCPYHPPMETTAGSARGGETASNRRGTAVAATLLTLVISSAMGSAAARRWRRAGLWLATELVWHGGVIASLLAARPRAVWAELVGLYATRAAAAADAFFLVRRTRTWVSPRALILVGLALAIGATGLATAIRANLVEGFQVPTASMLPTLLVGDHFFIDKRRRAIRRGDVIAFRYPIDPSVDYVKRVIALGGDTVEETDQGLVVNGTPVSRQLVHDVCLDAAYELDEPCEIWEETLDGHSYRVGTSPSGRARHRFSRLTVPPGTVFVVGDNRDNSSDSRVFGPVPIENVKGRALFIWWSSGPKGLRRERLNQAIR